MFTTSLCAGPAAAMGTGTWGASLPITTAARAVPPPVPDAGPLDACLRCAQRSLQAREFEAALGWFAHAAALQPDLALAHVGRAVSLLELGRDGEAAMALGDAREAGAAPGESELLLARLFAMGGAPDAAYRQLASALQAAPWLADRARVDQAFGGMHDHPRFLQALGDL